MAIKDAIATVLNRNAFYRDGYRIMLRISIIQGIVIALLIGTIVTLFLTIQTHQVYFATTSDGRIINIIPLNDPYRSPAEVIAWSARSAQNVMRFDYRDYHTRLTEEGSPNFTPTGWHSFTQALDDSGILKAMEARKLVVSLDLNSAPEIKNAYVKNGVYTWYLQVPITIHFDGDDPPLPIVSTLILQVVRVSTLQNPDGISIEQWVTIKPTPNGR